MRVHLRLFSIAKEMAGFQDRIVELESPARAAAVLEHLANIDPRFSEWKKSIRLAVNLEYVGGDHPLSDGDEVAVIPPVSGG